MERGHGTSSNAVKCAFCNKKTHTYISWGESIIFEIRVCSYHENMLRKNNIKFVDKILNDDIKTIRSIVLAVINDDNLEV